MNILIIDDNVALGETQAMMLEVMGHRPYVAVTGSAGIECAKSNSPRLVLLDLGLPDIDGYTTCRLLRQLPGFDDVIIVAQTGGGEPEDIDAAMAAGFNQLIVKPAPFETLEKLIASIEAS